LFLFLVTPFDLEAPPNGEVECKTENGITYVQASIFTTFECHFDFLTISTY